MLRQIVVMTQRAATAISSFGRAERAKLQAAEEAFITSGPRHTDSLMGGQTSCSREFVFAGEPDRGLNASILKSLF
jgi:hypothetical protein